MGKSDYGKPPVPKVITVDPEKVYPLYSNPRTVDVSKDEIYDAFLAYLRNKKSPASVVERKVKVLIEILNYFEVSGFKIVRRGQ